jgi:hypothetical protein
MRSARGVSYTQVETILVAVIAIEPGIKTDIVVVTPTSALNATSAKSSSCLARIGFVV